ncbi:MAG: threonine/serine exporter family protein [Lachnospiraceae bacterium]|nr:threonine/serine exporter family protein [Lachnospiraceae bacterium]
MIIKVLAAFVATLSFSVIMQSPKKYLLYTGITGALGWFIYLVLKDLGYNDIVGIFCATLGVALLSHIFARVFKTPVTIFLIPGIIPLVPGTGMYQIAFAIVKNEYYKVETYFLNTLQLAGMIALGIIIVDAVFQLGIPKGKKEVQK